MTHVRTSPFYPQSNGNWSVFTRLFKGECIRPKVPLSLEDARSISGEYIEHYNKVRFHRAIGYLSPADKLTGRDQEISKERDRKLEEARELRRRKRQAASAQVNYSETGDIPITQTA